MWKTILTITMAGGMAACSLAEAAQNGREKRAGHDSEVLEVAYALQVIDEDGRTRTVREDTRLHSGDRFAVLVKNSSPMHVYLLNRGPGDGNYIRLYPRGAHNPEAASAWDTPLRLPEGRESWMKLDKRPGNENLVLIASKTPIERLETGNKIRRDQVEDTLAEIERNQKPRDLQRWDEGEWTRLKMETQPGLAVVCRIPLLHR
jgi:hypothetical protein